jgi:hypothetical protein
MLIEVKQKHIRKGVRGNMCNCPIALAVEEVTGTRAEVACSIAVWPANGEGENSVYRVTRSCDRFMEKFDNGKKVKPFKFRLLKKVEST